MYKLTQKKITEIRKNKFFENIFVYLFSNVINASVPFLMLPFLTRYLPPVEYGEIAIFYVLVGAVTAFTGLSVNGSADRKYYDSEIRNDELAMFIGTCIQVLFFSTTMLFIVAFLFHGKIKTWFGVEPSWLVFVIMVAASKFIINIRLGQWQVRKKAKIYALLQCGQSFLDLFLSLVLVIALATGAKGRIIASVISHIAFALAALFSLYKAGLLRFKTWNPNFIIEALNFGIPLLPHVIGGFLLSSVDRIVINFKLGLSQAGIYMVAMQISLGLWLVFNSINKAYVPWLFGRLSCLTVKDKNKVVFNTYLYFVVILLFAFFSIPVGPLLISVIAGESYQEAGYILGWLMLGQTFTGMYLMVTNYIFYTKLTGLLSLVTVTSGFINLLLLYPFLHYFGLVGAAIAFCFARLFQFIFTWYVAHLRYPMPWFSFYKQAI